MKASGGAPDSDTCERDQGELVSSLTKLYDSIRSQMTSLRTGEIAREWGVVHCQPQRFPARIESSIVKIRELIQSLPEIDIGKWKALTTPLKESLRKLEGEHSSEFRSARSALIANVKTLSGNDPNLVRLLEEAQKYSSDESLEILSSQLQENPSFDQDAYARFVRGRQLQTILAGVKSVEVHVAHLIVLPSINILEFHLSENPPRTFGRFVLRLKELAGRMKNGGLPTHSGRGVVSDMGRELSQEYGSKVPSPVAAVTSRLAEALNYVADSIA
ncbi:MAG: hypothetical protein KDD64_11805 [Bdellovibrionales bacterium]|nr:hypothetical protein [Bdellovibrionales bacterium]